MLLYDPDCGLCTRCGEFLAPRLGCVVAPLTDEAIVASGIDAERARRAIPFVAADGRIVYGVPAIRRALLMGSLPWRMLARILGLPGLRLVWDASYRVVATNRHRLPGSTCRLP